MHQVVLKQSQVFHRKNEGEAIKSQKSLEFNNKFPFWYYAAWAA
jgi:hypothetical protein